MGGPREGEADDMIPAEQGEKLNRLAYELEVQAAILRRAAHRDIVHGVAADTVRIADRIKNTWKELLQ
jgi:hypothetical protein